MEGKQYIQHRVIDGVYQAVMHWKVENGNVYVKEDDGKWAEVNVGVKFVPDFAP